MTDFNDDEYVDDYVPKARQERGNVCCKSMTLLFLGLGVILILSVIINYFDNMFHTQLDIDVVSILIFMAGFGVGFIVREITRD